MRNLFIKPENEREEEIKFEREMYETDNPKVLSNVYRATSRGAKYAGILSAILGVPSLACAALVPYAYVIGANTSFRDGLLMTIVPSVLALAFGEVSVEGLVVRNKLKRLADITRNRLEEIA